MSARTTETGGAPRQRIASAWAAWRAWLRGQFSAPHIAHPNEPLVDPHPFAVLRRRLIGGNLLATAIVLLVVSGAVYLIEARGELAQIDQQLASEAISQTLDGLPATSNTADQGEAAYNPANSNLFSITVSPSGAVLQDDDQVQAFGLPDMTLARPVLAGKQLSNVATIAHGGYEFRVYTAPIRQQGVIVGAVQSGTSLGSYYQHLNDLTRSLVAVDVIVILLTLGTSVYLTDRSLKPARHAFERQRQFAAGASHELRTPLALIRSLAELVADHRCPPGVTTAAPSEEPATEGAEGQESVTGDAREIIHEVDYMTRLVNDLLLLARDERDRRALNWVTVDVRSVTRNVVEKLRPVAQARGVTLRCSPQSSAEGRAVTLVEGDPDRLRELVLILLENAVRYTPTGGSVVVSVAPTRGSGLRGERHGHVTLTVRDTGVGIAPEDQPHVFEPFYRANSSAMRQTLMASADGVEGAHESGGSGLGLALAHWIVEAHGGEISLTSALGTGTTFTVELPLVSQPRATTPLDDEAHDTKREASNPA